MNAIPLTKEWYTHHSFSCRNGWGKVYPQILSLIPKAEVALGRDKRVIA